LLAVIALIGGWQIWVTLFSVPLYLVPPPTAVVAAFLNNGPALIDASLATATEILLGFLLAIVVGVPLAIAIFSSPTFANAIYPVLISTQAIPKVAVAPLIVVWFGFGLLPKVLIAFIIAFFPIIIDTVIGLNSIEREKLYLARSMGLGRVKTFAMFRLPQALPAIFGGLKVAVTLAVVGAVVGEFVGADSGLGYLLLKANGVLDTPLLFAALVLLTIMGVGFFAAVALLERLVIPWHREITAGARESL
jgi:NitT/TauT family transport system permease protein